MCVLVVGSSPLLLSVLIPRYIRVQIDKIRKLLDNVEVSGKAAAVEKMEGMKYLLAVSGCKVPQSTSPAA
jgi:hypothetical protein